MLAQRIKKDRNSLKMFEFENMYALEFIHTK